MEKGEWVSDPSFLSGAYNLVSETGVNKNEYTLEPGSPWFMFPEVMRLFSW